MSMQEEVLVLNIADYALRILVRGGYGKSKLHDMVTRICNEEQGGG